MLRSTFRKFWALLFITFFLSGALVVSAPHVEADHYPAWAPNTAYQVGDLVSYEGAHYQAIQAHTSQIGWEPPNTPALWEQLSGGEPAPTATATPSDPEPTPPPGDGGSCTAPAWEQSAVYVGGDVVSHNGHEWRAKWWTQGEEPGTTGEWGVWEDLGACQGEPTPEPGDPTPTPTPSPTATPDPNNPHDSRIIGYFAAWGVYGRNYHVKNIDTSGSAADLTHINYAFANISSDLRCQIGDSYADYDRFYQAGESVDGQADTWDTGALRGSFNQLRKLKQKYPHLKILISIGGWSWSDKFSDAALPANRAAFVSSCIDMFIKGNFGPGLSYPGIFDGIDIDWEYPGSCGNTCNYRPEDTQNFTALLAEFRSQLNQVSQQTGQSYLLTIAAPAGGAKIDKIEVDKIHQYLDFINLMTYDFHGGWENTTNFNSPLYNASGNPAHTLRFSTHDAVTIWRERGTPANKLVIGVPFYGRGWSGVPSTNNGLWQSATGAAQGTYEPGVEDYKVLKSKGYPRYLHPEAKEAWLYSNGTFWSYSDPEVMGYKTDYVKSNSLGGVMFWELSGDTANGELINAISNGLK